MFLVHSFKVTRLCDLNGEAGNSVTSVAWSERGQHVAVGSHHGYVTVWDVGANKQVSVKKLMQLLLMLLLYHFFPVCFCFAKTICNFLFE